MRHECKQNIVNKYKENIVNDNFVTLHLIIEQLRKIIIKIITGF